MERLFVDTGAWFSYLNAVDPDHGAIVPVLEEWERRLVTTDYVFDELVTVCRYRVGHSAACVAGSALRGMGITLLVEVQPADREQAWEQFRREEDKAYSFTDCTSFAVMRRLGLTAAAAVDEHFRRAGFHILP